MPDRLKTIWPSKQIEKRETVLHTVFETHKKVSFNIASEASYVYILSGQKFSKKRQKWSILTSF